MNQEPSPATNGGKKIYLVMARSYGDLAVVGVFTSKAAAEAKIPEIKARNKAYDSFSIEEWTDGEISE